MLLLRRSAMEFSSEEPDIAGVWQRPPVVVERVYDAIRCVKCSESVIDQSHVGIWKEIRLQQIETLAWPDMGIPTIERAKNHIREAEAVLCDLGEPMDAYSFKESENVD